MVVINIITFNVTHGFQHESQNSQNNPHLINVLLSLPQYLYKTTISTDYVIKLSPKIECILLQNYGKTTVEIVERFTENLSGTVSNHHCNHQSHTMTHTHIQQTPNPTTATHRLLTRYHFAIYSN